MTATTWTTVGECEQHTYVIGELPVSSGEENRFFAYAMAPSWDGSKYEAWGSGMRSTFESAREAIRDKWAI